MVEGEAAVIFQRLQAEVSTQHNYILVRVPENSVPIRELRALEVLGWRSSWTEQDPEYETWYKER